MKKLIISALLLLSVFSINRVFASPELVETDSGLGNYIVKSSDENLINPTTEVENLEGVITNRVALSSIGLSSLSDKPIISGINDPESLRSDSRTCPFCWVFLLFYILILTLYAEKLRAHPDTKKWFLPPIIYGLLIFSLHTIVHEQFASPIFLHYYWMWIYDILVITYFLFSHYIVKPFKDISNSLALKKAKS